MLEWDGRMKDNHSVQVLKTAIPFLDVAVGERIDMEGLLAAVRPYAAGRERRILDIILNFFQMRRMMSMMQIFQSMQNMQGEGSESASEGGFSPDMFEMLKGMLTPDQQETFETMSAMMSMMQMSEQAESGEDNGPVNL